MTQFQAFACNCGNHPVRCEPRTHKELNSEALSRDAGRWGGGIRSSVEAPVMGAEQRGVVRRLFIFDNCLQDDQR